LSGNQQSSFPNIFKAHDSTWNQTFTGKKAMDLMKNLIVKLMEFGVKEYLHCEE
jgi:hypothetical protein